MNSMDLHCGGGGAKVILYKSRAELPIEVQPAIFKLVVTSSISYWSGDHLFSQRPFKSASHQLKLFQ